MQQSSYGATQNSATTHPRETEHLWRRARDQSAELFEPIADIGSAPFDYSVSNEVADLRHRESTRARGGPPSPQAQPSPRARATHVESSTGRGHGPRQRGVKQLGDRDGPRSGTALRSVTPSRVLSQTR